MGGIPSQITAASLTLVVIAGVKMFVSLGVFSLTPEQVTAIQDFVTVAAGLGFAVLLYVVNRGNPNPTAPTNPNPPAQP